MRLRHLDFSRVYSDLTCVYSAGFTIVDCLALGALGHGIGAGIILGLKNTGVI